MGKMSFHSGNQTPFLGCPARYMLQYPVLVSIMQLYLYIYRHVNFSLFCPSLEQRALYEPIMGSFDVLLTVHLSIILAINQINVQNLL